MKVKLLEYTPNPERVIAMAAKLCYSKVGVDGISEKLTDEEVMKFLDKLVSIGHESPIEHINFTFAVEGISRACSHQIVRHRIASYSQQSQRYVKLESFEYIVPPHIKENPRALEVFTKAMEEDQKTYDELVQILKDTHNKAFLAEGKTQKQAIQMAEKKAIEDARYVFPNACETKMVFTMNARTLMHFFKHRCCERAQWEIRDMATQMLSQVRKVAPVLFGHAGPNCLFGACPEGVMTCGHIVQVREKFNNL